MGNLKLYRGIAIPSSNVAGAIDRIRTFGLTESEGIWNFEVPDIAAIQQQIDALFQREDLTKDNLFSSALFAGICACGTEKGASYYALRHNNTKDNDHPLVIELMAPMDSVYVDCRDFLCTAFQGWDSMTRASRGWQGKTLVELFGVGVTRYFSAACESASQSRRIFLCNLAAFDPVVVEGHYANRKVIRGRYGTSVPSRKFATIPTDANSLPRIEIRCAAVQKNLRDMTLGSPQLSLSKRQSAMSKYSASSRRLATTRLKSQSVWRSFCVVLATKRGSS